MSKKIYVSFHIGRGGLFNNPGNLTFSGEENFQDLIERCLDISMIINEDENGNTLPDADWQLIDRGDNVILRGREEIEAMIGRLNWDGEYDTDYVTTIDNLSSKELSALVKAYQDGDYMSDELKNEVVRLSSERQN